MISNLLTVSGKHAPKGVRWIILTRVFLVTLTIFVLLARSLASGGQWDVVAKAFGSSLLCLLLLSYACLNALYFSLLNPLRRRMGWFLFIQFTIDAAFISILIFLTGGIDSGFIYLYFILIGASSLLLARRASALFASLSTIGIAIVTTLYSLKIGKAIIPPAYYYSFHTHPASAIAKMLAIATALFVVAYLAELLAARLEMARTLNEEILQNMQEGIAVFDNENNVVFWNDEFEKIFANKAPLQLGDSLISILRQEEYRPIRSMIQNRIRSRFELEETPDRPPLEIRTSALDDTHSSQGMIILAIDLSPIKRAKDAERLLDRYSAINEMAAGLAHEIRNPLASVRGSVQEISSEFEPGTPNRKLADIVLRESDRLNTIITDFLQFARQRKLSIQSEKIGPILEDVKMLLRSRHEAANMEITLRVLDDPQVDCDTNQLREVFLNLGLNAIAATDGHGKLEITFPAENLIPPDTTRITRGSDSGVTISFRDNGPGINKEELETIFEPFHTTKAQGSGLGLAIAKRVVETHEGKIWAENLPDGGAAFMCWLPLSGPSHIMLPTDDANEISNRSPEN